MPDRPVAGAAEAGAAGLARLMWTLAEPIHAISYFAAGARQAFEQGGVRAYWRGLTRERLQPARGWTGAERDAAARLTEHGLLAQGAATAAGTALCQRVEDATDEAAARPWSRLDRAAAAEFAEALRPIARACAAVVSLPARSGASGTSGS